MIYNTIKILIWVFYRPFVIRQEGYYKWCVILRNYSIAAKSGLKYPCVFSGGDTWLESFKYCLKHISVSGRVI